MGLGERFDSLTEVALDASSIIYMLKAGFLGLLGHTIRLVTIEPIREETGWSHPQVLIRPEPPVPAGTPGSRARLDLSNDERLLRFAAAAALPVVSDDRELLEAALARGLEHYNSLMMLLFLRHRRRIDEAWYEEAYGHLMSEGRYSPAVVTRFRLHCRELGIPTPPGPRSEPPE